jgi:hypothetical protein
MSASSIAQTARELLVVTRLNATHRPVLASHGLSPSDSHYDIDAVFFSTSLTGSDNSALDRGTHYGTIPSPIQARMVQEEDLTDSIAGGCSAASSGEGGLLSTVACRLMDRSTSQGSYQKSSDRMPITTAFSMSRWARKYGLSFDAVHSVCSVVYKNRWSGQLHVNADHMYQRVVAAAAIIRNEADKHRKRLFRSMCHN